MIAVLHEVHLSKSVVVEQDRPPDSASMAFGVCPFEKQWRMLALSSADLEIV